MNILRSKQISYWKLPTWQKKVMKVELLCKLVSELEPTAEGALRRSQSVGRHSISNGSLTHIIEKHFVPDACEQFHATKRFADAPVDHPVFSK